MKAKPLTNEQKSFICEFLRYEPESGKFFWKKRPGRSKVKAGDEAGHVHRSGFGYVHLRVPGRLIAAHRVAYWLLHGVEPDSIDHVDGNPSNNSAANLRAATAQENAHNTRSRAGSSRYHGVSRSSVVGKWRALLKLNRQQVHLGTFDTEEEAALAYLGGKAKYHPTSPMTTLASITRQQPEGNTSC